MVLKCQQNFRGNIENLREKAITEAREIGNHGSDINRQARNKQTGSLDRQRDRDSARTSGYNCCFVWSGVKTTVPI